MILVRILHIFAGVYWAGTAFFIVGIMAPTVEAAGAPGGQFMSRMIGQSRYTPFISAATGLTALSGIVLFWRVSGQVSSGWITSGTGYRLKIGGLAGLIASIHGGVVLSRKSKELVDLGQRAAGQHGPPAPEELQGIQRLQKEAASFLPSCWLWLCWGCLRRVTYGFRPPSWVPGPVNGLRLSLA